MGLPVKIGFLHLPQLGLSVSRSLGRRLVALHFGHVTFVVLIIVFSMLTFK
ncbi:MAG: hypothetical protein ACI9T9_000218 [Oleiphilaceae bacterium]